MRARNLYLQWCCADLCAGIQSFCRHCSGAGVQRLASIAAFGLACLFRWFRMWRKEASWEPILSNLSGVLDRDGEFFVGSLTQRDHLYYYDGIRYQQPY